MGCEGHWKGLLGCDQRVMDREQVILGRKGELGSLRQGDYGKLISRRGLGPRHRLCRPGSSQGLNGLGPGGRAAAMRGLRQPGGRFLMVPGAGVAASRSVRAVSSGILQDNDRTKFYVYCVLCHQFLLHFHF